MKHISWVKHPAEAAGLGYAKHLITRLDFIAAKHVRMPRGISFNCHQMYMLQAKRLRGGS